MACLQLHHKEQPGALFRTTPAPPHVLAGRETGVLHRDRGAARSTSPTAAARADHLRRQCPLQEHAAEELQSRAIM